MNIFDERYLDEFTQNDFYKLSTKKYLLKKQLEVKVIDNGVVLPPKSNDSKIVDKFNNSNLLIGKGGIVDARGRYLNISSQKAEGMKDRVVGAYNFDESELRISEEKVIYLNYFIKQWGHFLLDVVGRLWYPLQQDSETKIAYTCFSGEDSKIEGNYLEFFNLLGIDESRLLLVNKPTQFKQVIVPESSILPGSYYTSEYKEIFNKLVRNVKGRKPELKNRKIYCSRSKLQVAKNKEFGESKIEKIFLNNGYSPIYPETMTLSDQIKALRSADVVVMSSGSLAHNLLFIDRGIEVFILNKTYRMNLHQFLINEISEAKVKFVDFYIAPLPVLYGYGPFLMDITKSLRNFFDDNNFLYSPTSILTSHDYRNFYKKWLWFYKKHIIKFIPIREGDNEFEKSLKELRRNYKLSKKDSR